MKANHDKAKLEQFFQTVAHLTKNHRCLRLVSDQPHSDEDVSYGDIAWVAPNDLGNALAAVDPNWWK